MMPRSNPVACSASRTLAADQARGRARCRLPWRAALAGAVILTFAGTAPATEMGHEIAAQVSAGWYQHYLDDLLFTRNGDDREFGVGADHDAARDNIAATFALYGYDVEFDVFPHRDMFGVNVVATRTGFADPDAQVVIGAHYDSVGNPGADDDASGVAAILEIARVFSRYRPELTIKLIAFDAEEKGLVGSKHYVQQNFHDDIRAMISVDMIGWEAGTYAARLSGTDEPFKLELFEAVEEYGGALAGIVGGNLCCSDHNPFLDAGFSACCIHENLLMDNPCYHRTCDSVDNPGYFDYVYASDITRCVAGFLADRVVPHPLGDMNCDQRLDGADVDGFLLALVDPVAYRAQFPGCDHLLADMDGNGSADGADIDLFFACLGGHCP